MVRASCWAVDRLKADPAAARRLGQAGHDYVAAHYDREKVARQYLDYLTSVVG